MLFWIGGKILTIRSTTCFDSKLEVAVAVFSGIRLVSMYSKRELFLIKFNIALCVQVNNQLFAFSNSTFSLFIHNFSKTSCTISSASFDERKKLTANRNRFLLCISTTSLNSCLFKMVTITVKTIFSHEKLQLDKLFQAKQI